MSEDKILSFLKTGPDWGRLKTSIHGIFLLKMPPYRNSPARVAVELNPVNSSNLPTKKRGLVIRSKIELEQFKELFQFEKLAPLLNIVDNVNPHITKHAKQGDDVLEI
tara:strand:+ start:297 stop:620 length:324 start_codon:yes stop_codon:yes gene_type:complete